MQLASTLTPTTTWMAPVPKVPFTQAAIARALRAAKASGCEVVEIDPRTGRIVIRAEAQQRAEEPKDASAVVAERLRRMRANG
jgi:hypothetical protein